MFKSGGAVVKRGYVWNQTEMAATMCNRWGKNAVQAAAHHLRFQCEGGSPGRV